MEIQRENSYQLSWLSLNGDSGCLRVAESLLGRGGPIVAGSLREAKALREKVHETSLQITVWLNETLNNNRFTESDHEL